MLSESCSKKLEWMIRVLGSLEYGLRNESKMIAESSEDIIIEPDWGRIQAYLHPEVILVLGKTDDEGWTSRYPAFVVVPELGDYHKVTDEYDLDALKTYLDLSVPENRVRESLVVLGNQAKCIPEKNTRAKIGRLLAEISKLLDADV